MPPAGEQGKRFAVVVHGERVTEWSRFSTREEAERAAAQLSRTCGFVVSIEEAAP